MSNIIKPGNGLIFMKVGLHAKESIEDIIKRKQDEYAKAGCIFWGYGGNTCFPTSYVQPFVRQHAEQGNPTYLIMHKMNSNHRADPVLANEYSDDGVTWKDIPKGINVTGSRFAMIIGGLNETEFDMNLRDLVVGIGRSEGRRGMDYMRGRVDKGCFEYVESHEHPNPEREVKRIDLYAQLMEPYAVFVRRRPK